MADVEESNHPRVKRRAKKPRPVDDDEAAAVSSTTGQGSITNLLKEAYESQEQADGGKKKKRKKKPAQDSQLIENVRASLEKDQDQGVIDANTYDPEADVKKERRLRRKKKGEENDAFEGDEAVDGEPKKVKKRGKKKAGDTAEAQIDDEDRADEGSQDRKRTGRKKVRRKEQREEGDAAQAEKRQDEEGEEVEARSTRPRRRKKARDVTREDETAPGTEDQPAGEGEAVPDEPAPPRDPATIADEGRVLSIIIHRTDRLKTDLSIAHPLVRVHIMDKETGRYMEKQHKDRRVISYYEDIEKVGYILPIMTQPCDFKKQRSTLPVWEEKIVFNENVNYITDNERTIIFFELLDFLSAATAANQYRVAQRESGWYRVAYAFLRPLGANGNKNTDKKVRLQLYEPPPFVRNAEPDTCYLFDWWVGGRRAVYPSTLYVTLSGMRMAPPEQMHTEMRSLYPNQAESGSMTYHNLRETLDPGGREERLQALAAARPELWTRLPGQMCKVPNKLGLSLVTGTRGCSTVRFSHEGGRVACACSNESEFPILVYEFPSGSLKCRLVGHRKLVYDLSWSRKSKLLLSASADGTARVWSLAEERQEKVLAHPSFVYAAQFHPRVTTVVVTAAFDRAVRVWGIDGDRSELLQELEGHSGFVNSLAFNSDGKKLYSGDSAGTVCVWNVFVTEQHGRPGFLRDWTVYQKIAEKELDNVIINHVQVHPSDKRLLIHTRDNTLRMLDLRVGIVMQRYLGALNFREHIRGCISPCGTFVMSGSEDRCVYVWNSETGDQVAVYRDLNLPGAVCCVDYHPLDHSAAFAALLPNAPLLVFGFDVEIARHDAGMYTGGLLATRSRPTSPVVDANAVHDLEATRLKTSKAIEEQEERLQTIRSERNFADAERFRSVVQKVNTVTQFATMGTMKTMKTGAMETMLPGQSMGMTSTWGSTFDRTEVHAAFAANMSLGDTARQFASQREYMRQGAGDWRPQFAPVGKGGTVSAGRPPQLALTMAGNKATFAFHQPKKDQAAVHEEVVAVYDYKGERASDLSFVRGEVIQVLYKENDNWWLGQLQDGSQGYFPTNYVTGEDHTFMKDSEKKENGENGENMQNGAVADNDNGTQRVNYSALVDKMGDLHILSEPDEEPAARGRRKSKTRTRQRRGDESLGNTQGETQTVEMNPMSGAGGTAPIGRRRRSKARQLAETTA